MPRLMIPRRPILLTLVSLWNLHAIFWISLNLLNQPHMQDQPRSGIDAANGRGLGNAAHGQQVCRQAQTYPALSRQ